MTARGLALLEAHRDELNARFARSPAAQSPAAALAYLRRMVVPVLDAWEGEPSAAVLFALFDVGLVGLRFGVIGETEATDFERALVAALPALRPHVERSPGTVLRAVGNGYLQIDRASGTDRARTWLAALARGADRCADPTALFDLGVVASWCAGLAEAREAAFDRAARLPPSLVTELFGADVTPDRLDPDPARRFCRPGSRSTLAPLAVVATTGGFVGFGGPFQRPPVPRFVADRLVCTDGLATFEVCADYFGTRMRAATWAHAEACAAADPPGATLDPDRGIVQALGGRCEAAVLRGVVAAAVGAGMVAVTLYDSHHVFVLGRREASR